MQVEVRTDDIINPVALGTKLLSTAATEPVTAFNSCRHLDLGIVKFMPADSSPCGAKKRIPG